MGATVDGQLARAGDDDEELGLVVLVADSGDAGGDTTPAGADTEALDRGHVDAEGFGQFGFAVVVEDHHCLRRG